MTEQAQKKERPTPELTGMYHKTLVEKSEEFCVMQSKMQEQAGKHDFTFGSNATSFSFFSHLGEKFPIHQRIVVSSSALATEYSVYAADPMYKNDDPDHLQLMFRFYQQGDYIHSNPPFDKPMAKIDERGLLPHLAYQITERLYDKHFVIK